MATYEDFQKIDIRVGKITAVEELPDAKYTTHKLTVDLGKDLGKKISCARVVQYKKEELMGRLILCLVNTPPRQIGKTMSEVLTLGVPGRDGECTLIVPEKDVELGGRVY